MEAVCMLKIFLINCPKRYIVGNGGSRYQRIS